MGLSGTTAYTQGHASTIEPTSSRRSRSEARASHDAEVPYSARMFGSGRTRAASVSHSERDARPNRSVPGRSEMSDYGSHRRPWLVSSSTGFVPGPSDQAGRYPVTPLSLRQNLSGGRDPPYNTAASLGSAWPSARFSDGSSRASSRTAHSMHSSRPFGPAPSGARPSASLSDLDRQIHSTSTLGGSSAGISQYPTESNISGNRLRSVSTMGPTYSVSSSTHLRRQPGRSSLREGVTTVDIETPGGAKIKIVEVMKKFGRRSSGRG